MLRETVADLRADVNRWLPVVKASLDLSQNKIAREMGIDTSVFSRWLSGKMTSEPCARAVQRRFPRLKDKALRVREKAS